MLVYVTATAVLLLNSKSKINTDLDTIWSIAATGALLTLP